MNIVLIKYKHVIGHKNNKRTQNNFLFIFNNALLFNMIVKFWLKNEKINKIALLVIR